MVFNLTKEDKEEKIKDIEKKMKKGVWMIRYYADWCGHCQMMESEWKTFEKKNSNKNIVSIESQAMEKMNQQPENFGGFPTIIIQNNNKKIDEFNQERTFKNFQKFLNSVKKIKNSFKTKTKKIKQKIFKTTIRKKKNKNYD